MVPVGSIFHGRGGGM
jgi:hypothetical protein